MQNYVRLLLVACKREREILFQCKVVINVLDAFTETPQHIINSHSHKPSDINYNYHILKEMKNGNSSIKWIRKFTSTGPRANKFSTKSHKYMKSIKSFDISHVLTVLRNKWLGNGRHKNLKDKSRFQANEFQPRNIHLQN